jgi:hypothetical protein
MSDISRAIWKLRPGAEFSFTNEDYSTIKWDKIEGTPPTLAEIEAALKEIAAEEIAQKAKSQTDKAALLAKLGITEDEARLLLS